MTGAGGLTIRRPRRGTAFRGSSAEARRRGDEVPGAGGDQSAGRVQLGSERIGRALQERRVVAGGDQCRDAGVAEDVERRTRLSRRSTAVSATHGADDVLRKRPDLRKRGAPATRRNSCRVARSVSRPWARKSSPDALKAGQARDRRAPGERAAARSAVSERICLPARRQPRSAPRERRRSARRRGGGDSEQRQRGRRRRYRSPGGRPLGRRAGREAALGGR